MPDFRFENHGTLWLVRPQNAPAREHLEENVSEEAQWFGGALVVEPRYAEDLAFALVNTGWEVAA